MAAGTSVVRVVRTKGLSILRQLRLEAGEGRPRDTVWGIGFKGLRV
jgi:hypothetical protein